MITFNAARVRRYLAACAALSVAALTVATFHPQTAHAATTSGVPTVDRFAGSDRLGTAVAASQADFPTAGSAGAVVLASATNYPDALVGVPLAVAKHAPLLLTSGSSLPAATSAELTRVLPGHGTVYILGGPAAVPSSITTQVQTLGYTPVRYAGADRFTTATAVAQALGSPATVALADGDTFQDALIAGPAATHLHGVVLLSAGSTLPAATAGYVTARHAAVYTIGKAASTAYPHATHPMFGQSGADDADAVASTLFTAPSEVGVASQVSFPDGLTGGAMIARAGGPLLLADPQNLPAQAGGYLSNHLMTVTAVRLFGGPAALADTVEQSAREALGLAAPASLSADMGHTPNRCSYVVGYQVNVSKVTSYQGNPDIGHQLETLQAVRAAVADLSSRTGQAYRYDGLTSFVPTAANWQSAPDDLVITFVDPAATDFYGAADGGQQAAGYTRWMDDLSGHSVIAIDPTMVAALPLGFDHAGGVTLYAMIQHELGHSVGLSHSPSPTDVMYGGALSATTPVVYSADDTARLASSSCRS